MCSMSLWPRALQTETLGCNNQINPLSTVPEFFNPLLPVPKESRKVSGGILNPFLSGRNFWKFSPQRVTQGFSQPLPKTGLHPVLRTPTGQPTSGSDHPHGERRASSQLLTGAPHTPTLYHHHASSLRSLWGREDPPLQCWGPPTYAGQPCRGS